MGKEKFDIVYSLGQDCACAQYLIKFGLRICAGPFDWLTGSDFETRMNLILNDFDEFFEKEDIKLLALSKDKTMNYRTDDYHNSRIGFDYYHDFRAGIPFDEEFLNVKKKYARRTSRFINNIKTKNKILLVYHAHLNLIPDEVYIEYHSKLQDRFKKEISLVIIENDFNKTDGEIETLKLSPNLTKYKLLTEQKNEAGNYTNMGNEYNCSLIYSKFSLKSNLCSRLSRKTANYILKFLMRVVPIKKFKWIISEHIFFNE